MKRVAVALAASVLSLMPYAAEAEPQVLTASQMDEITAGGVFVDVIALADAMGDFGRAVTQTRTRIVTTPWTEAGFGTGSARAVACCGSDAEAEAESLGIGAADGVFGGAHGVERQSSRLAYAVSVVTVVVISRASRAEILQDLLDMSRGQSVPR